MFLCRHPHMHSKQGNCFSTCHPGEPQTMLPTPRIPFCFATRALLSLYGPTLVMALTSKLQSLHSTVSKVCGIQPFPLPFPVNGFGGKVFLEQFLWHAFTLSFSLTPLSVMRAPSALQHLQLFSPLNQLSTAPTFHNVAFFSISSCEVLLSQSSDRFLGCKNDLTFL